MGFDQRLERSLRLRKRIVRASVFLLLGAVVNVGVAWGSAIWVEFGYQGPTNFDYFADWEGTSRFPSYTALRWWRMSACRVEVYKVDYSGGVPGTNTATFDELIPNWGQDFLHIPELDDIVPDRWTYDPLAWGDRAVDARGWPCLAVWGGIRPPSGPWSNGAAASQDWMVRGAIPLSQYSPKGRNYVALKWLPYLPVWPGFAINSMFYAATIWLLFTGPRTLRRWRRLRRGLCVACGYPVGQSATCTECGKRLHLSANVRSWTSSFASCGSSSPATTVSQTRLPMN